jgi:pSer/pThr/pTyr-binding forkhead associated (FHA) protein
MAKLILTIDDVVVREHALTKERTTLGRKSANDIQIDNLAVSGEHAVIFTLLNDSFIEDLSSTNGTLVNGKPIRRHMLQNGDVIALGKHRLQFVSEAPPSDIVRDYERTMVVRGVRKENAKPDLAIHSASTYATETDSDDHVERPSARAAGASAGKMPLAEVQILNGAGAGRTLELTKRITTIGKAGGDIAVVARRSNGYFLAAVEGAMPLVNGRRLNAQAQLLNDHDIMELAGVKLEFYLKR